MRLSSTLICPGGSREFDRVPDQIADHLLEPPRVAQDERGVGEIGMKMQLFRLRLGPQLVERRFNELRERDRLAGPCAAGWTTIRETSSKSSISRLCARALRSMTASP